MTTIIVVKLIDTRSKIRGISSFFIVKKFLIILLAVSGLPTAVNAETFYLYFGTYESKERATRIEDNPTLHASPFSSLTRCEAAGKKIFEQIYKPIKFFDGKWVCVEK
tara:strand:- start:193 stop:516 length:324 start_codon:yes stop_codon:yes gene_type:complete